LNIRKKLSSFFGTSPLPENHGTTGSRNYNGTPAAARQPKLTQASRKMDGSVAEGSTV